MIVRFNTARLISKPAGFFAFLLWALFGNADDPTPPADYMPTASEKWRAVCWWFRNPLHNLCFYVLGCCDEDSVTAGKLPSAVFLPDNGFNWYFTGTARRSMYWRPFLSHRGRWFKIYIGFRSGGSFGVKFQRNRGD